jgi:hypothetical protein
VWFVIDLDPRLTFQHINRLLKIRMRMRYRTLVAFGLPQDDFKMPRPINARADQPLVARARVISR